MDVSQKKGLHFLRGAFDAAFPWGEQNRSILFCYFKKDTKSFEEENAQQTAAKGPLVFKSSNSL